MMSEPGLNIRLFGINDVPWRQVFTVKSTCSGCKVRIQNDVDGVFSDYLKNQAF